MDVPLLPDGFVPDELVDAFDGSVPPGELALWAAMTPDGRTRALKRLSAVRAWESDATAGSAQAVADDLHVSRSRFYRMVSDWRSRPSLASLGAKAPAGGDRGPRTKLAAAYEILREEVPRIVAAAGPVSDDERVKVSPLVRVARNAVAGLKDVPGETAVRRMVEQELRRRAIRGGAGSAVVFDLCAVAVPGPGGVPPVLFACVDVNTRIVFGIAVSEPEDSRDAYRAVARDALARIATSSAMPGWAPRFDRAQVAIGTDSPHWAGFFEHASAELAANVQAKGSGVRFGGDVRGLLGDALGRIRLLPLRPGTRAPLKLSVVDAEFSAVDAKARIEAEVIAHNAAVVASLGPGAGAPTPGLLALLRMLAD